MVLNVPAPGHCFHVTFCSLMLAGVQCFFVFCFSSPEPSGSQGELIVYPCSGVHPSVHRRLSTILKDLRL